MFDPVTLAIMFATSAVANKLGGASTKDSLKSAAVNTGINALLPGAGTTGNPFVASMGKMTGQNMLQNILIEGAKKGIMQRASKSLGIDPMLLNAGLNIGQGFLPQNLTQGLTSDQAFPGMSPSEIIKQSTQYGSVPEYDFPAAGLDLRGVLPQAQVPTSPGFDIDSTYTGGEFDITKGNGDPSYMGKVLDVFKTGDKYDIDKIAKGATLFGVPALLYASGAFKEKPKTMYQPTYNINYPKLREARGPMKRIDPVTGRTVEVAPVATPEELYASSEPYAWSEKTFYPKEYNQGGLASIQKFNEGGMSKLPSKISHDENDINNYMRVNGYIEDHNGHKDEDTLLAQLADGEFVTRTDGVLGAGIIAGANPKNEKEMRQKGAKFFYEQQKRFKRVFDLLNENRARKLH